MFQVWSNLSHRPTRDLDLLGAGELDVDRFVEIFRDLCVQGVERCIRHVPGTDFGSSPSASSASGTHLRRIHRPDGVDGRPGDGFDSAIST